jgi:uncharacterized protein involved in exopolysaccharide biosynthesis
MNRESGSARDILTVLFKHKQKIVAAFLVVVIAVAVGTFLTAPTYEAKSSLLVKFGREYFYTPEVGEGRPTPLSTGQEELINSEVQILTDNDLIGKVIASLGPNKLYPGLSAFSGVSKNDAAINQFRKSLIAEPVRKSNVIQVSFKHQNPELSAKAVNLLVDLFRQKHLQLYAGTNSAFLAEQVNGYSKRLKDAEGRLEAFKQQHKVYALEEQRGLLFKQRMEADSADKEAESRMGELEKKIASLQSQMRSTEKNIPVASEQTRLRVTEDADSQLLALRLREQELLEKYNEDNRIVVNLRKEIAVLEDFLKRHKENMRVVTGKNPVYEEMEKEMVKAQTELASLQFRRASLRTQIASTDKDLKDLDAGSAALVNLTREVEMEAKNLNAYRERAEEARLSDILNLHKMANIAVIQQASIPTEPIKPRMGYNLLLALILGCVSGFGLAFFSEYAGQSLSTPQAAEKKLDIHVLGSIEHKG